jgi:hypothetical protein
MILSLEINNIITFEINDITKHILDYFKELLGIVDDSLVFLDSNL